ncbi:MULTISPECIES: heavy-metal-associated domain-containing protein [Pseudomonas]|uniref:Copper chaperone CopZ n=1 Tax=Pseudomonas flexibilis TaxID=706570 RepID=A0A1N6U6H1_9PSED|nr:MULTISPECIES: heavy-metal-associated domain-containing protein [Pseudomonas]KHL69002.1 putative copper-binding protein [Pseudomonas flexibilis]SIQ60906.1 Copper chaperone CopZ [Pseudomonas flexibilis]
MTAIELMVEGMTCGNCAKHVDEALRPLAGVQNVEVDLAGGRVRITGDADSAALIAALDDAGYPARLAGGRKSGGSCCGGCCG